MTEYAWKRTLKITLIQLYKLLEPIDTERRIQNLVKYLRHDVFEKLILAIRSFCKML